MENLLPFFQAGFHGAALVFLYLGFRLLKQVVGGSGPDLRLKLASVRFFLLMSLAFFVVGAGLQIYQAQAEGGGGEHRLLVNLSPTRMPDGLPPLDVRLGGQEVAFTAGRAEPTIAASTDLTINAEDLRDAVVALQSVSRSLQVDQAATSPEVGLGADPAAGALGLSDETLAQADAGQLDAAADRLAGALDQPGVADPAALKASLGWVHFTRGDFSAAEQVLEQAAAEATDEPTRVRALNNLGRVLLQKGDLDASRRAFTEAGPGVAARDGLTVVDAAEAAVRQPG